ncbi:MAG: ammonium transporter [Rhodocyclaceae bacterium]|nr:ammonium transporter [Rhodocyclaceae bacterium]
MNKFVSFAMAVLGLGLSGLALASDAAAPAAEAAAAAPVVVAAVHKGDVAWMLTATLLVIFMAVPGLALFYGGLVRAKNMLSVLMQVMVVFSLISVLWAVYGYSLAFGGEGLIIAGFDKLFLSGVGINSLADTFTPEVKLPEYVFIAFQATFAGITCALIVGSFAERMRFSAVLLFSVLWFTFSYLPIAHMVWGAGGYLLSKGALDFAGGTVVHINAGVAGLVDAYTPGQACRLRREALTPHSLTLTMVGASMLWVGWVRLQRRLQPRSDERRRAGLRKTRSSPRPPQSCPGCLPNGSSREQAFVLGAASGAVAGLVAITPACGSVGPMGCIVIGLAAGVVSASDRQCEEAARRRRLAPTSSACMASASLAHCLRRILRAQPGRHRQG